MLGLASWGRNLVDRNILFGRNIVFDRIALVYRNAVFDRSILVDKSYLRHFSYHRPGHLGLRVLGGEGNLCGCTICETFA